MESSFKKLLSSILKSINDEELCEARQQFSETFRDQLVSPVIEKVYKDLFPYVCAVAAVLIIILVFVLMMMFFMITRGLVPSSIR